MSILFVTNGHGEAAIAERIARELRAMGGGDAVHFPLVGTGFDAPGFPEVGPRSALPSGGLVAMGNVGNFVRDVRAGFLGLLRRQWRFLRESAGRYAAVVAVGDVYALALAYRARTPTIFVGTAKSEYVAPYGPFERRLMRKASVRFVRDDRTAAALGAAGVAASAANVIADLASDDAAYPWPPQNVRMVLLPGSREDAYADAVALMRVVRLIARQRDVYAAISIAPTLDPARMARLLESDGWTITVGTGAESFVASLEGKQVAAGWHGPFSRLFPGATLVLGQAGTANEAAAAYGLPIVALETPRSGRESWYRMRQGRLLGPALEVVPGDPAAAAAAVARLLDDPMRLAAMADAGRARMGPPGAAATVARAIADVAVRARASA